MILHVLEKCVIHEHKLTEFAVGRFGIYELFLVLPVLLIILVLLLYFFINFVVNIPMIKTKS